MARQAGINPTAAPIASISATPIAHVAGGMVPSWIIPLLAALTDGVGAHLRF